MVSKSDGDSNLDPFINELANKVLEGTEGWDRVQFVNKFLQVEKITKEQKQKNREDWR